MNLLLDVFFNVSCSTREVTDKDKEKLQRLLLKLGVPVCETVAMALTSGDWEGGGGDDETTWLEIKTKINEEAFYEVSEVLEKYWRA